MTLGEERCGRPPQRGGAQRRGGYVIYIHQFFQVFVDLFANYLVSFSTPDLTWNPPQHVCTPFSKMGSSPEACRIKYGVVSLHFDSYGAFLCM